VKTQTTDRSRSLRPTSEQRNCWGDEIKAWRQVSRGEKKIIEILTRKRGKTGVNGKEGIEKTTEEKTGKE